MESLLVIDFVLKKERSFEVSTSHGRSIRGRLGILIARGPTGGRQDMEARGQPSQRHCFVRATVPIYLYYDKNLHLCVT